MKQKNSDPQKLIIIIVVLVSFLVSIFAIVRSIDSQRNKRKVFDENYVKIGNNQAGKFALEQYYECRDNKHGSNTECVDMVSKMAKATGGDVFKEEVDAKLKAITSNPVLN